jgi:DNA-binding NarL/FixJ family response regulator
VMTDGPEATGGTASAPPLRFALLTDDQFFAAGLLRSLDADRAIDVECVGVVSGITGIDTCGGVEMVLLDSRIDGALASCRELSRERALDVILLAVPDDDAWLEEALAAGARGLIPRRHGRNELVAAIRSVPSRVIWAPRRLICAVLDRLTGTPARSSPPQGELLEEQLSAREQEVLRHVVRGFGNKELAVRLTISEATVKAHLTNIFRKLGVRGRSELAAAYFGVDSPATATLRLRHDPVRRFSPAEASIIRKS